MATNSLLDLAGVPSGAGFDPNTGIALMPPDTPPQAWPAAIGAPFRAQDVGFGPTTAYSSGRPVDATGRPNDTPAQTGNMSWDAFVRANSGPGGFWTWDQVASTPLGPPLPDTTAPGTGQPPPQRPLLGKPEWMSGTDTGMLSTNNPNLMAAMGYGPQGRQRPPQGYDYPFGAPPSQWGGGRNLGEWIMRNGHIINTPDWRIATQGGEGRIPTGPGLGYPFGFKNISGVAYPVSSFFWPGQMENAAGGNIMGGAVT